LFLAFSLDIVLRNITFTINLYQLTDTLRFSFAVDRLAAYFMMIISLLSTTVCFYSLDISSTTAATPVKTSW